jgi:hypothetical protein
MKIQKLLIGLLFLFQSLNLLHAKDVYVSSSDELINACNNATSGDVIYIASGTYNGPFVINSKSDITLTSYNGDVIIEGSGSIVLIEIYNSSNITINNLVLRNNLGDSSEGIKIHGSGDGFNITNCEFYNIGWNSSKATMPTSSNSAHAIVIVGSESESLKNIFIGGNYIHDCITGYSESLTLVGNVEYFLIEGNKLENNTNIGIVAAGNYSWTGAPDSVNFARSGIIRKNVVSSYAGPEELDAAGGIYSDGGCYITIENNMIFNYKVGISIGCENANKNVYGNIVRNNLVYSCDLSGLFVGSNTTSMVYNTEVNNNTFYKCGTGKYDNGQIALQNNSGTMIKNNILYPENWRYAIVQMGGSNSTDLVESYNLYWRENSNTDNLFYNVNVGNNAVLADPLFVDVSASDFHISGNSPAIDAGDPNFTLEDSKQEDLDGNSRIINNRIDIGSYEVFKIIIDGSVSDWNNLPAAGTNNGTELKVYSNDSAIFLAGIGTLKDSYQFFIDTDNNALTGYTDNSWSDSGAEILIENGSLYYHNGNGWDWTFKEALEASKGSGLIELKILLSSLTNLADTINLGYKDLQSWTVKNIIPVSGSKMASHKIRTSENAPKESIHISLIAKNKIDFDFFPNPVKNFLNISSNNICKEVLVFDLSGQEVARNQINGHNHVLNLMDLSEGLYLCNVRLDDNTVISRKIVIQK